MISVIYEIWRTLKPDLEHNSIDSAAESVIDILLDHDYDINDIRKEFKRDKDFLSVLKSYEVPSDEDEEDEYEEEEEEEEYYDDEDEGSWH